MHRRKFSNFNGITRGLRLFTLATAFVAIVFAIRRESQGQGEVSTSITQSGEEEAGGQPAIPNRNLIGMIRDGGLLMIPILGSSFIMMAFCFERALTLRRGRVIPRPFVKRVMEQLRESQLGRDEALQLCDENASPVARVFASALRKWGRPAVEVEQAAIDAGERVANDLRRYLLLFHGISTVSPLLGLLGTVFGMIECFNVIAQADALGRPELLAGGISEALLTTAAGLSVAIPALCLFLFFSGRADRLVMEIDSLSEELVGLISAERGAGEGKKRTPRTAA